MCRYCSGQYIDYDLFDRTAPWINFNSADHVVGTAADVMLVDGIQRQHKTAEQSRVTRISARSLLQQQQDCA